MIPAVAAECYDAAMVDGPDERFWSKVKRTKTCWLWTGTHDRNGYGRASYDGRPRAAHRVAYALTVGAIPEGLTLDHLCRVRDCVNPEHLEPVTRRENIHRELQAAGRLDPTHCANGHEYTPENTYVRPSRPGRRECRQCKRDRMRKARSSPLIPLQPCGTRAAYKRHLRRGEPVCAPCQEAARNR